MKSFFISMILAIGLIGAAVWYFDLTPAIGDMWSRHSKDSNGTTEGDDPASAQLGDRLYPPIVPEKKDESLAQRTAATEPIILPAWHLMVKDRLDVPAESEGTILLVGNPLKPEELKKLGLDRPMPEAELQKLLQKHGLEMATVDLGDEKERIIYREWNEGDMVQPGDTLAVIDYTKAEQEFRIQKLGVNIATLESASAETVAQETHARYERERAAGSSLHDIGIAKATYETKVNEAKTKKEAIEAAKLKFQAATITKNKHWLRNTMTEPATIKTIYKKRSHAVKFLEPVMQLHSISELRAEKLVDAQLRGRLRVGMPVVLEPLDEEVSMNTLHGHTNEIASVAISGLMVPFPVKTVQSDGKIGVSNYITPYIVSGSRDRTMRIWMPAHQVALKTYPHPKEVVSVACAPQEAGELQSLCVSGCSDGSIRLFDLRDLDAPPKELELVHGAGVTALAFSPDGRFFASGGEDNLICIWDAKTGSLLYRFDSEHGVTDPHQGSITMLRFTPQCQLVSASRDNSIRVWDLYTNGARLHGPYRDDRAGNVAMLDVSTDGQHMIFDRGRSLHFLSVDSGELVGYLHNYTANTPFDTLAIFNSDASLLLTAGAPEGRLQLWRTPLNGRRGFEVQQWTTPFRSPVTCAAFGRDAGKVEDGKGVTFAVSGTKDGYLYVWRVPGPQQVAEHQVRGLKIDYIDHEIEGGHQVKIAVDVPNQISSTNPQGRFQAGDRVTIVIE